jgi:hypothetical protein
LVCRSNVTVWISVQHRRHCFKSYIPFMKQVYCPFLALGQWHLSELSVLFRQYYPSMMLKETSWKVECWGRKVEDDQGSLTSRIWWSNSFATPTPKWRDGHKTDICGCSDKA